jgi:hypothetical protein
VRPRTDSSGCTGGRWGPNPAGRTHTFHRTPGAPREDYFETLADAARRAAMSDDERAEFMLRHDTYWL